jgi:hypothetical protein
MTIVISAAHVPGKVADVDLHFDDGDLAGLKLVGFAVFEANDGRRHVTFPARPLGEGSTRRVFQLLRPLSTGSDEPLQDRILAAVAHWEREAHRG